MQTVLTKGKLHLEFEGDTLYGSRYRLWLDMYIPPYSEESVLRDEAKIKKHITAFQDKTVLVRGIFSKSNRGHFLADGTPVSILSKKSNYSNLAHNQQMRPDLSLPAVRVALDHCTRRQGLQGI